MPTPVVPTALPKDNNYPGATTPLHQADKSTNRDPIKRIWVALCVLYPIATLTSIAITNLLLVLIVLGWLIYRERLRAQAPTYLLYFLMLYVIWSFFASITSPYAFHWHDWLVEFSTMLAIIPGFALSANVKRLITAYKYAGFVMVGIAIYAVYQYFFGWDVIRSMHPLVMLFHRYHATGFQDFHLTFAGVIGMSAPIATAVSGIGMAVTVAFGGAVSILSSMARSMMIGYGVVAILFLVFGSRKLKISGLVIGAATILLMLTVYQAAGERMARGVGVSNAQVEQGDPTRIYMWQTAAAIIQHYPLKGVGHGNWGVAFEHYKAPFEHYSTTAHAHNDFLYATVKYGFIGGGIFTLFWLLILITGFKGVWQSQGYERDIRTALLASIILILLGGLVQCYQTDAEDALILWMLVGVLIGLPKNLNTQVTNENLP